MEAATIANQLGQHSADMNEMRINAYKTGKLLSNQTTKQDEGKRTSDDEKEGAEDLAKVPSVVGTAKAVGTAAALVPATLYRGGTLREGIAGGKDLLDEAGNESKLFGEGASSVKDLTGIEGIVGGALVKGGGEAFAKFGAKAFGNVGAAIDTASDFDNLLQTGNIFDSKNAQGKIVKPTTAEDIGNAGTIIAGGLDILAAFTGGALAPIAAAANIAVAAESTTADMEADSATAKKDSKDAPPPTLPPPHAAPAFAQLGMLANQSHNPIDRIG